MKEDQRITLHLLRKTEQERDQLQADILETSRQLEITTNERDDLLALIKIAIERPIGRDLAWHKAAHEAVARAEKCGCGLPVCESDPLRRLPTNL